MLYRLAGMCGADERLARLYPLQEAAEQRLWPRQSQQRWRRGATIGAISARRASYLPVTCLPATSECTTANDCTASDCADDDRTADDCAICGIKGPIDSEERSILSRGRRRNTPHLVGSLGKAHLGAGGPGRLVTVFLVVVVVLVHRPLLVRVPGRRVDIVQWLHIGRPHHPLRPAGAHFPNGRGAVGLGFLPLGHQRRRQHQASSNGGLGAYLLLLVVGGGGVCAFRRPRCLLGRRGRVHAW